MRYTLPALCLCITLTSLAACRSAPTPVAPKLTTTQHYNNIFKKPVSGYVVVHRNRLKYNNLIDAKMSASKRAPKRKKPSFARLYQYKNTYIVHKVIKDHGDVVEVRHLSPKAMKHHCATGYYSRHTYFYVNGFIPKRDLTPVLNNDITLDFQDGTRYTFKKNTPVTRATAPKRIWDFVAHTRHVQLPVYTTIDDLSLSYKDTNPFNVIKPKYNKKTKSYEPKLDRVRSSMHLSLNGQPIWAKTKYNTVPYPLSIIQTQTDDKVTLRSACLEILAIHSPPKRNTALMGVGGIFGKMGIGLMGGNIAHTYIPKNTPMYWEDDPKKMVTTLEYKRVIKNPSSPGYCFANRIGFGKKRLCVSSKHFRRKCKNTPECTKNLKCTPNTDHTACIKTP